MVHGKDQNLFVAAAQCVQPHKLPKELLSRTSSECRFLCVINGTRCLKKSKQWHFCLSFFLSPICQSKGQHSSRTTGELAEESDACRDALEMGSESQQERFKRLTSVSNSMALSPEYFRMDSFMPQKEYVVCVCVHQAACRDAIAHTHGFQLSHRQTQYSLTSYFTLCI